MAAARKKAAERMANIDVVIEVVDARLPGASTNPMIEQLRLHRQRPCLKILNKADLADPAVTAEWLRTYGGEKLTHAVALSCKKPGDVAKVPRLAAGLVPHRDSALKPARMMVMGIPNVGKSTLINALLKRKAANTGDEPAITKHQSRYDLGDRMELVDTPGLMWPKIEYPSDGLMLAASHAIGENAFIDEEVATFLAETLLERYPALLAARYGCATDTRDGTAVIEAIAKRRGFRIKGGGLDYEKAGLILLHDYRNGALGRISLETPPSRTEMLASARRAAEAKNAEAEARRAEADAVSGGVDGRSRGTDTGTRDTDTGTRDTGAGTREGDAETRNTDQDPPPERD
jgi:ribosome biogenesis GTPase A